MYPPSPRASRLSPVSNEPQPSFGNSAKRRSLFEYISVLLGALLIPWPAFYNGLPLLYPDTLDYVRAGHLISQALFFHRMSGSYGIRSRIYSLGILPFCRGATIWPLIALQCLLTSFVLWMVVRSLVRRGVAGRFLALILFLSLFTSLSWYGALAMPDILGPDLYLCVY